MSLETLNSILDFEFSRPSRSVEKASGASFVGGESRTGGTQYDRTYDLEERYSHYRERFYSAARVIVHRIASQPVHVARQGVENPERSLSHLMQKGMNSHLPPWAGSPGSLELLDVHPFLDAFMNPNPYYTNFNMMEMVLASLISTGRGFMVAVKGEGRSLDLYAIPATWMEPGKNRTWKVKPPSSTDKPVTLSDDQVCQSYFADPSNPGKVISPLKMLARAVLTDEAISSAQHNEFKNGVLPKVALIAGDVMNETTFSDVESSAARPVRLEPSQRREIVNWVKREFVSTQKYGTPIVLDAIIRDIKMISRTPAEMAFLDSASLTKEQIYEGLGVPKVLNGQFTDVNRASGGLAEQFFADNVLNPIVTMLSQSMTKKFGPLFSVGEKLVIWMEQVIPNDPELRLEWARLLNRAYAIKPNELRKISPFNLSFEDEFERIAIPQVMDQRDPEGPHLGVGRDENKGVSFSGE